MAAPEYVPVKPIDDVRTYASPPRRPDSWRADRPGDLGGGQPRGDHLGSPGPDQGYALTLVRQFDGQLELGKVLQDDAVAGCVAVAKKRASLFGRAPVVHDLRVAFTIWGFLDLIAPSELVALRERVFAEVANPHHYAELRRLVDAVPESVLRKTPKEIEVDHNAVWRDLIDTTRFA